jgi:hypothetical protein
LQAAEIPTQAKIGLEWATRPIALRAGFFTRAERRVKRRYFPFVSPVRQLRLRLGQAFEAVPFPFVVIPESQVKVKGVGQSLP